MSLGTWLCNHRRCALISVTAFVVLLVNALYWYASSDSRFVLAFSIALAISLVAIYAVVSVMRTRRKVRIETVFLLVAIGTGVLYMLVFAPSTVPDEMYHFESSYKLADYLLFLNPTVDSMLVRADDAQMIEFLFDGSNLLNAGQYQAISASSILVQDPSLVSIEPVSTFDWGSNPPQVKIVSALGIVLARLLNLGSYPLFYLGRLFNLLFFIGLVYLAIRATPVGKRIMVAVALLPMTMHLASSYSYDAGIIGFGFLLTGLCLRAIYGEGLMSARLGVAIGVVAVLLAPCKVVYAMFAFLVFAIPVRRFSCKRDARLFKFGIIALVAISVLGLRVSSLIQMAGVGAGSAGSTALSERGTETGTFYTLSALISQPVNTVLLFLRTFDSMGDNYLGTTVGRSLGWFQSDIAAPWYVAVAFLFVLAFASVRCSRDAVCVEGWHRFLFAGIVIAAWLGIMLSMLLGWTFDYELVIQGVQGRYLLPLLPLLLIAAQTVSLESKKDQTWAVLWSMLFLNCLYLTRL